MNTGTTTRSNFNNQRDILATSPERSTTNCHAPPPAETAEAGRLAHKNRLTPDLGLCNK